MAGRKARPKVLTAAQAGNPTKPATIRTDPEANKLWIHLTKVLAAQRVLSPADGPALTALCSAHSRLIRIRAALAGQPLVMVNESTGATKAHPLLATEAGAASEVSRYSSELGLSPTARARISKLAGPEDDDGFDDP